MKNSAKIIVVTARCIDMAASCEDIDRVPCTECGEITWLSSSWRGKKIDKIVCGACFEKGKYKNKDHSVNVTEECLNDAAKFVKENYGRSRSDKEVKKIMMDIMEKRIGRKINIEK